MTYREVGWSTDGHARPDAADIFYKTLNCSFVSNPMLRVKTWVVVGYPYRPHRARLRSGAVSDLGRRFVVCSRGWRARFTYISSISVFSHHEYDHV